MAIGITEYMVTLATKTFKEYAGNYVEDKKERNDINITDIIYRMNKITNLLNKSLRNNYPLCSAITYREVEKYGEKLVKWLEVENARREWIRQRI
jgi:hypothetical protein